MKITKTNREGPAGSFTGKGSSFVKEKEPVKDLKKNKTGQTDQGSSYK